MNDLPSSSDDERTRRLLNDAISDVEPRPALDDIRRRTTSSRPSPRPWIWGVGAAVVATAATITGVALVGGNAGTTGAQGPGFSDGTPTIGDDKSADPREESNGRVTVPVYYVGDTSRGPRLFREVLHVGAAPGASEAEVATTLAVNSVRPGPADADYRTDWPAGTEATVDSGQGVITVDLVNPAGLEEQTPPMTANAAAMAVEQVIYTVQASEQTRDPVRFLVDGNPVDHIFGVPTSRPLTAGDPTEVLAQVWIIDPTEGAKVRSGFEVTGLANAFEANVQWELMQGEQVVKSGFTTAEECCTMAPYSFTVEAPPGDYTLVVHDSDPSGGEGFPPWKDTKDITITN